MKKWFYLSSFLFSLVIILLIIIFSNSVRIISAFSPQPTPTSSPTSPFPSCKNHEDCLNSNPCVLPYCQNKQCKMVPNGGACGSGVQCDNGECKGCASSGGADACSIPAGYDSQCMRKRCESNKCVFEAINNNQICQAGGINGVCSGGRCKVSCSAQNNPCSQADDKPTDCLVYKCISNNCRPLILSNGEFCNNNRGTCFEGECIPIIIQKEPQPTPPSNK